MKNKSSDNTSNIDSLPERNQEPTENGKIKLLDVVALTQDVPEHNLKRGEVGTVVEILSNGEAYEVEFSDDNGQMYKCLSFPASQLEVFHQEPIKADSKRQATDSMEGYRYQILHSVNAWLDLADNDILYLEIAEDFDIESDGTLTATQVKHTQDNITLRSQQVIDGINNYWELRTNNPDRRVKFRLLTKSEIGKEQGSPLGIDTPGLEVWSRCSGDEAAIKKISNFLQTDGKISAEVNDFLKMTSPQEVYEQLIEPITWDTDGKDIDSIEQEIREKLINHGKENKISPSYAKKIFAPLLAEAFAVATRKDNRKLTKARFLEIFEEQTTVRAPIQQYIQSQQPIDLKPILDHFKEELVGDLSEFTIQFQSPIQTGIPPLNFDATQRTGLLTKIQDRLQSDGIAIIQGGVDKGKTTLANLTAKAIEGKWFWLKLTNIDSSQVPVILKQLANTVSHESAQVNVVIDDLNLQPQELQAYEEDLSVVAYRVLERGAKLLITSQYNPPNNLTRSLGLSSSIVVDIPDFTIPEIEQFAAEMGCPTDDTETWVVPIQAHTGGHPRLVHAWLVRLKEKGWDEHNILSSLLQPPEEVKEEREAARLLITDLPKDRREFLYRLSLMSIGFRKDYALNVAEIPEPIFHPGDVFSQLVGPWIDQVSETYYTVSPLLTNAAKEVWSESRIKDLHAYIANAILKTKNLTTTEAWAVLTHSMIGQNRGGFISVIQALMTAQEDDWENLCQEFSWLVSIKTDPHEELFPGDAFVNQMFRSLQYRIAVEVKPELVPKILEIWDKETKPYKPRQSYLLSRLMLTTEILKYNQGTLPVKKLVGYLKEIIDIRNMDKKVWKSYFNSMEELKEINIDESNFFSFLFSFIYMRPEINAVFLNELIDILDKLDPKIRTLLLVDFENDTIQSQLLNNGVWLTEENLENPNWTGCLEVFDKVIKKTIAWGYPYIAAASARIKAITHDEKLGDPDTAHKVLQDIISKLGTLPTIEEAQAVVYFNQKRYKDALNIYERILPEWNPSSEQLDIGPLEEYRRAAICAASLGDWKKASIFLQEGAKRTQKIENTERYIGSYADAGFAYFKAGNMFNCIKMLHLALQNFETLPQDNTDVKYFTLKKRLEHTIKWIWEIWYVGEANTSNSFEPSVGFCSDPETKEEFLTLPDYPIGYSWLYLSQIEYRFGHETIVFQHALQTTDREEYPILNYWLSFLEAQYDFRNKTFDNLPQRIYQLALIFSSMKKHQQRGRGAAEKGSYPIADSDLSDFASVDNIIAIFIAALVVEMRTNRDAQDILAKWRTNSSELPIQENIYFALDFIEPILLENYNNALKVMYTSNETVEKQLAASIRVIHNQETSLEDLLFAHTIISSSFINSPWEDFIVKDLGVLLSVQWVEKIEFRAKLKTPMLTVPQIEKACKSNETGKKKIGQILLAAHQAVSVKVPLSPQFFQQFRAWTEAESKQKQKSETRKNPAAQRLIKAMEKPPHLTDEDIEALNRSIKEGEIPIEFDSPFDSDESNK